MSGKRLWRYLRPLVPLLLLLALTFVLWEPVTWWLNAEEMYDRDALKEWVQEAKVVNRTLPELVSDYLDLNETYVQLARQAEGQPGALLGEKGNQEQKLALKREEIQVHLKALGDPLTKLYLGQLPLFPVIYRLEVCFDRSLKLEDVSWDSELPRQEKQYHTQAIPIDERGAYVSVLYQLRVYSWQQTKERQDAARRLRLSGLAVMAIMLVILWIYVSQRRERERQRQRLLVEQQVHEAERRRLEEELRRQEAERRQQEAERLSLELKSQLFANIGIMAGSYAHNIKNLLVRPNDLLSRCLEADGLSGDQDHMLREVRQTLGTVTERLQQILQTVRRDPTHSERVRIDLNSLAVEMKRTWDDLAREKWKLTLSLETAAEPLFIEGDLSHLQQAIENLLFNARDATFEMRNYLRELARRQKAGEAGAVEKPDDRAKPGDGPAGEAAQAAQVTVVPKDRRQALIAAAAWKGVILLRTRRQGDRALFEVQDNGIGMTEDVARRCLETHFSTKRDNALFAGLNAGMGLGLSFVAVILEHHRATLQVESQPLRGAIFRASFPLV